MKKIAYTIRRVFKKLFWRLRGIYYSWEYGSGAGLRVGSGCQMDIRQIRFGKHVTIYGNVHIFGSGTLCLKDHVAIGDGTVICVNNNLTIGNDTLIAAQCYLTDCNHGIHRGGGQT